MNTGIVPLQRDRRGRRIKPRNKGEATTGNPGTLWRRLRGARDNWEEMERIGANPDLGTIPGKLFLYKVITATQASALRLAGEVVGRYDRFYNEPALKREVASPSYQRGSRGENGEIEQRIKNGTIEQYERMARRAKKAFVKLNSCFPTEDSRKMVELIAIEDREIDSCFHKDLRVVLDKIIQKFGLK
jgi:hypothetical protein